MGTPLKYTNKGIPKNWDGRDWQTYKWAMKTVFREKGLEDIAEGKLQKTALSDAENEDEFDQKETKIMRMVGTSVPPELLHQIRDKTTGSEMWAALCDLFENKDNKTVKAHTIRRLRDELWSIEFPPGGHINVHLSKMFNMRTELQTLQNNVDDIDMVEMMCESLPNQPEFESLKSSIHYSADCSAFTPTKVRELIRAAASRQQEFRNKDSGHRKGQKSGGNHGGVKGKGDSQHQEKWGDSKKKKTKKCFICESTSHLKADCPERVKPPSGAEAETEQKRKLRGNVTIRQSTSESPDEDINDVTTMLDSMMLDAGVGSDIRDEASSIQEHTGDHETD